MTETLKIRRERAVLGVLSGVAMIALLFATLWPFNIFSRNKVNWAEGGSGINIGDAGVVVGDGPFQFGWTGTGAGVSLEFFIRPAQRDRVSTILSFYRPDNPRQLWVREYQDGLLVSRDSVSRGKKTKTGKFDVAHAFQPGQFTLVTLTSGTKGTAAYLDGRVARTLPKFTFTRNDLAGQIVLGTSAVDYQPWTGEIRGLAIYGKELTATEVAQHYEEWAGSAGKGPPDLEGAVARYAFQEGRGNEIHDEVASGPNLEKPRFFRVPHKGFLKTPVEEFEKTAGYALDIFQNVVGFMPLGFVLCGYLSYTRSRWKAVLYATLTGGLLSLTVEVLQFYIPQRASGMTDIITNTLGTAVGAAIASPGLVRGILWATEWIWPRREAASRPQ